MQPKNKKFHTKKIVISLLAIVPLLVGLLVFVMNSAAYQNYSVPSQFKKRYGNCSGSAETFSYMPLADKDFESMIPLGRMADAHVVPVDHVYLSPVKSAASGYTIPVVMPADGRILEVSKLPSEYKGDKNYTKETLEDYYIAISHSCRIYSVFIHLHKLASPLSEAVGNIQPDSAKRLALDMKAGQTIGYVGNDVFDWSVMDTSITLPGFISPRFYKRESQYLHIIDPTSLYQGELKSKIISKSLRKQEPYGGRIDWDISGKLIGNWFKVGTKGMTGSNPSRPWDGQLAIVPEPIDNSIKLYSTGNWQGIAKQFKILGSPDIAAIGAESGMVKYELSEWSPDITQRETSGVAGVVLLQVLPKEKLKLEQFPGKTANEVTGFTSKAITYER